ncbi:MAG TPA: LamG-like jellyroll fold domain-containing protein, partial [Candidatus Nanoarchaeia archaeon]|nr:LamG-like jellyroll fold domain-containing protein [Candidatus Nanoarchaeia archaeon]
MRNNRILQQSRNQIIKELALIEKAFSQGEINPEQYQSLLNQTEQGRTRQEWLAVCNRNLSAAEVPRHRIPIAILLVFLVGLFTFMVTKPAFLGYVTVIHEVTYIDELHLNRTMNSQVVWFVDNPSDITGIRLSGLAGYNTSSRVYIENEDEQWLLFDSNELENEEVVLDITGGGSILDYGDGSSYDADNDGRESLSGIIDFEVDGSTLNYAPERMCTIWGIENEETGITTKICFGEEACCSYNDFESTSENYDDPLYINYGLYGAGWNNVVTAQIYFVDYNLSLENPSATIDATSEESLAALFVPNGIVFTAECVETCLVDGFDKESYELVIETDGLISLDTIAYTTSERTANKAPIWQQIPSLKLQPSQQATINLSQYATDSDNDGLIFSSSHLDNISISIVGSIAIIIPDSGYIGKQYLYFVANDSESVSVSNTLELNVVSQRSSGYSEELSQGVAVIGRPVKWTKKVSFDNPLINASVNISENALNFTVKRAGIGIDDEISGESILVTYGGLQKTASEFINDKKVEIIDKEIDALIGEKKEAVLDKSALQTVNEQLIQRQNEKNKLTGYAISSTKEGFLSRFLRNIFNTPSSGISILGMVVGEVTETASSACGISVEYGKLIVVDSVCNPVEHVKVKLISDEGKSIQSEKTEEDGSVDFSDYDGNKVPASFQVILDGQQYDLGSYETGAVVQLLSYSGGVLDSQGNPIEDVSITLQDMEGNKVSKEKTNESGIAHFEVLPGSTLQFAVDYNGEDVTEPITVAHNTFVSIHTNSVVLTFMNHTTDVISNSKVTLRDQNGKKMDNAKTNSSGQASFELLPETKFQFEINYNNSDFASDYYNATSNLTFTAVFENENVTFTEIEEEDDENVELIIAELVSEMAVDYYTDAPTAREVNMSSGVTQIIVESDIHYTNILAYSRVRPETKRNDIHLYWLVNNTRKQVAFDAFDKNNNSLIDYIQWIVPRLSNQTYEIILITKAYELDENRTLVRDVYDYVSTQDFNYTTIEAGNYVRVTFEQILDKTKDITLYARANNSNTSPKIEVYPENSSTLITTFENISDAAYYQVLLVNLINNTDTFDLKILNASVDIDYMVDPSLIYKYNASTSLIGNGTDKWRNHTAGYTQGASIFRNKTNWTTSGLPSVHAYNYTTGFFRTGVFYNQSSTYWNITLSLADSDGDITCLNTSVTCNGGINTNYSKLVSYWDLDSGGTNSSPNGDEKGKNDGINVGTNNATGLSSGAVRFDGTDDEIYLPKDDSGIPVGYGAGTIVGWVYINELSRRQGMFGREGSFVIAMEVDNKFSWRIVTTNNAWGTAFVDADSAITSTGWYHLVGTYNGSNSKMYVNGVLQSSVASATGTITNPFSRSVSLGCTRSTGDSGCYGPQALNGFVDEVLIFNNSLTASQIKDVYKAGLSQHAEANITLQTRIAAQYNISDSGLVGFWPFEKNATDVSANSNDGTPVGVTNTTDGIVGNAYSFDGVNDNISIGDIDFASGNIT